MVEQNEAGVMARKPIENMDRDEVMVFIERADPELVEQALRLLRGSQKPANEDADSAPQSTTDSSADSHGFANPREQDADEESMVSPAAPEPDVFDADPAFHAAYVQTEREMTGRVSDEEAAAARAFGARYEPASAYLTAQQSYDLVERIRRAYRER
jgi:hypothetical protein